MLSRTRLVPSLALLAGASAAQAQTVLHTYTVPQGDNATVPRVAFLDDLDGDGYPEWAVGASKVDTTAVDAGQVVVLSGLDHSLLQALDGTVPDGRFGRAVANVGDLDGDGISELAVGASGERTLYVYSGATLALLWSRTEASASQYGVAIAPAGDFNGDGSPDIVVGASGANGGDGAVYLLTGPSGTPLSSYTHPAWQSLGASVCGAGDLDGDGLDDVVAGAPYTLVSNEANAGTVAIIGGPTATLIDSIPADAPFDLRGMEFGYSVTALGDLDEDGVNEFAVGAPWYGWIHYIDDNWVGVYSGATRNLLWSVDGPSDSKFGNAVANGGDLDLDGHDDLLVGDPFSVGVYAYSVARDVLLFQWSGSFPPYPGDSLAAGVDIDQDGWLDFATGGSTNSFTPPGTQPNATLLTYGCWPDAVYEYCTAVANSTGQRAKMGWQNSTSITSNDFRLSASQCPPDKPGLFFYGTTPTELPVGEGHLCVTGSTYRLPVVSTGPTGTPSFTVDFTSPPNAAGQISAGETWYFSFWFRDPPGGPAGFNFADGLRATFCP